MQNTDHIKYLKYKNKYMTLKNSLDIVQEGGAKKMKNKKNMIKIKGGMEPNYIEHLSEPWFTLISLGLKTVEGRKNKGKFKDMKVGDIIKWTNDDFKNRTVLTRIVGKNVYKTFAEYLEEEGLEKCLPGIPSLEHGLSVYFKYFTKEDEAEFGVVAIKLELI
jgi:ASC-1-like (ASCH) protein